MPSSFQPADALRGRIVTLLRSDAVLSDLDTGLLFKRTPQIAAYDLRVYSIGVELPEDSAIREALPRVHVQTMQHPSIAEQQGDLLEAPVSVITHVLARKEDEELAATIDARVAALLLSTELSDVRIIAAGLAVDGTRTFERITALDGAWEVISRYRSANVGVLT
jgi:hypothetical protein